MCIRDRSTQSTGGRRFEMGAPRQAAKTQASRGTRRLGLAPESEHWNKQIRELEKEVGQGAEASAEGDKPTKKPTYDPSANQVWLEVAHEILPDGHATLEFSLTDTVAPKTCKNFRALCTGEKGGSLTYQSCPFHLAGQGPRLVDWLVGGDIEYGDGTGGRSIYGQPFLDETNPQTLDQGGLLATVAGTATDANTSQFILTLVPTPQLAAKGHVVFGRVERQNPLNALDTLRKMALDEHGHPVQPVRIVNCGSLANSKKRVEAQVDLPEDTIVPDGEINKAVKDKAKRARLDGEEAVTSVKNAVAFGLKKSKKSKQDNNPHPQGGGEPGPAGEGEGEGEGEDEDMADLLGNDF
eukprot:TRINITY_DN9675_c0_g1_i15.p1 TRINITY_DN9675_c0_g1~~TRINITY_DN9675_c0_g1_i15.p1  ORF type:complete len:353 (+),score=95.43 TRINITY_DN9675_c0_g1_i15:150-1208(+)